jgi:hypothetical protein
MAHAEPVRSASICGDYLVRPLAKQAICNDMIRVSRPEQKAHQEGNVMRALSRGNGMVLPS